MIPQKLFLTLIFIFASFGLSLANDVYLAQSAQGGNTGADCADAKAYSYFNSSGNWTSGTSGGTQIGPGTTVHLCGTFTMPAGTVCALSFQGGGSPTGGQVTLLFEANALATAPYWTTQTANSSGNIGGFICGSGQNYITVDGGTNGTIQATANGANLGNNNSGAAICMSGSSNSEVKNVTIANMYVASKNSGANGNNTYAIVWLGGSNVTIDNNTTHDCRWCIQYWYPGSSTSSNLQIFNNTIYNTDHCISIGDGNGSAILNGTNLVYGNVCHDWFMFDNGGSDHHDGFHIWAVHGGSVIKDIKIYNNYIYGDIGQTATAYLYIDVENGDSVTSITTEIFNNLIVNSSASDDVSTGGGGDGLSFCQGSSTCFYYNNTFVGATTGGCCNNIAIQTQTTTGTPALTLENNIYSTLALAVDTSEGGTIVASDYNDYYNLGSGAVRTRSGIDSFSQWQASSGDDGHSVTGNPQLNSSYHLTNSTSAAWQAGTNLTGVNLATLDIDRAGVQRPPSSPPNWDMGVYYDSGSGSTSPAAPTGLAAQVN